jgi:hypothetical protein
MPTTVHQPTRPVGLSNFLASHRECSGGLITLQDRGAVTILCRGCEASFSFLTNGSGASARDVDHALARLANGTPKPPRRPRPAGPGVDNSRMGMRPSWQLGGRTGRERRAHRLSPPGPWAPRRKKRAAALRAAGKSRLAAVRPALQPLLRWRRVIAVAALVLIDAYLLITLSSGGQPVSSSQSPPSLNGSDVPVTPGGQEQVPGRASR